MTGIERHWAEEEAAELAAMNAQQMNAVNTPQKGAENAAWKSSLSRGPSYETTPKSKRKT